MGKNLDRQNDALNNRRLSPHGRTYRDGVRPLRQRPTDLQGCECGRYARDRPYLGHVCGPRKTPERSPSGFWKFILHTRATAAAGRHPRDWPPQYTFEFAASSVTISFVTAANVVIDTGRHTTQ